MLCGVIPPFLDRRSPVIPPVLRRTALERFTLGSAQTTDTRLDARESNGSGGLPVAHTDVIFYDNPGIWRIAARCWDIMHTRQESPVRPRTARTSSSRPRESEAEPKRPRGRSGGLGVSRGAPPTAIPVREQTRTLRGSRNTENALTFHCRSHLSVAQFEDRDLVVTDGVDPVTAFVQLEVVDVHRYFDLSEDFLGGRVADKEESVAVAAGRE